VEISPNLRVPAQKQTCHRSINTLAVEEEEEEEEGAAFFPPHVSVQRQIRSVKASSVLSLKQTPGDSLLINPLDGYHNKAAALM